MRSAGDRPGSQGKKKTLAGSEKVAQLPSYAPARFQTRWKAVAKLLCRSRACLAILPIVWLVEPLKNKFITSIAQELGCNSARAAGSAMPAKMNKTQLQTEKLKMESGALGPTRLS